MVALASMRMRVTFGGGILRELAAVLDLRMARAWWEVVVYLSLLRALLELRRVWLKGMLEVVVVVLGASQRLLRDAVGGVSMREVSRSMAESSVMVEIAVVVVAAGFVSLMSAVSMMVSSVSLRMLSVVVGVSGAGSGSGESRVLVLFFLCVGVGVVVRDVVGDSVAGLLSDSSSREGGGGSCLVSIVRLVVGGGLRSFLGPNWSFSWRSCLVLVLVMSAEALALLEVLPPDFFLVDTVDFGMVVCFYVKIAWEFGMGGW